MTKRNRRTFPEEFEKKIVQLYGNGKTRKEIIKENDLTSSSFDRWISHYKQSGSFKEEDNPHPNK